MSQPASSIPSATYREIGPLAAGGMAELFEAERDDGHAVVIKRIRPAFVFDDTYRALFFDEGQVQGCICHPNVVTLLDKGEDERGPYLVFERVFGTDLGIVLDNVFAAGRPLELAQVLAIAIPLMKAIDCVHLACGDDGACLDVIHRDISPGNVLLSEGGEIKLADFGVAKSALKTQHTVVGEMKGKFAYMAPEQTRGQDVCKKADLFAAGIVLYECLVGERLFDGPSDVDVVQAVRELDVPPPSAKNPDVPPELDAFVLALLAKAPADRPESAGAAVRALEDIALDLCLDSGHKRQVSRLARAHPRTKAAPTVGADAERRKTQRVMGAAPVGVVVVTPSKSKLPLVAVGALAVALVGTVGVVASQEETQEPTPSERITKRESSTPSPAVRSPERSTPSATPFSSRSNASPTTPTTGREVPSMGLANPTADSDAKRVGSPSVAEPTRKTTPASTPATSRSKSASHASAATKTRRAPSGSPGAKAPAAKKSLPPKTDATKVATSPRRPTVIPVVSDKGKEKTVAMASTPEAAVAGFGRLYLAVDPWARVYVDGAMLGITPVNGVKIKAGRHVLEVENPVSKIKRKIVIDMPKDGEFRKFIDLAKP